VKISIITPSFNRAGMISDAIESVMAQNYPDVEHIIIDGGSTDGTLDVLKNYPHLRVVSEPDQGMYDALNKGLGFAIGEIIGFLNTDDAYTPNVFGPVVSLFDKNPTIQAVNGVAQVVSNMDSGGAINIEYPCIPEEELHVQATIGTPAINAWFFRSGVIKRLGLFDTNFKISADRHFILKFLYNNLPYQNIYRPVYLYRQHDGSMTITGKDVYFKNFVFEHLRIAEIFLLDKQTPAKMKKACRHWHSRDTAVLAILNFVKSPRNAFIYTTSGMRFDKCWPLYFAYQFVYILKHGPYSINNN
jgi:glycosyltransferase involved in cell wall biosynthesis